MTCQEVDDLAAPYALGALVREERVQLEAHLETCSKHAAVLEQYRGTVGFLHMTTVDTEPPASLKTGILSAIRSEEEALEATRRADSATRESIPATLMETHPRSRAAGTMRRRLAWPTAISMPWPGLALPAVVLLSLLAWNLSLQFSDDSPSAFSRYMSNEAEGIHGQIYFVEDVGVITVEGLPELQAGESYQAWAVIGNQVMSLGALGTTETGDGFVLLSDHVTEDEPVFITVESQEDRVAIEAGSPTGRVVLSTEP